MITRVVKERVVAKIRNITVAALKQRLTLSERTIMRTTSDIVMSDIYDNLTSRTYINLDDPAVEAGLLSALKFLALRDDLIDTRLKVVSDISTRLAELLIDGNVIEKYNGSL